MPPTPPEVVALAIAGWSVAYFVLYPWAVLVHELGHAAVVLAATTGRPRVRIGVDPDRSVSLGRLTVAVDPRAWHQGWYGYCRYGATPDGQYGRAALSLAGPAASTLVLAATLAVVPSSRGFGYYVLVGLAWWTGVQLLTTFVPVTYPEWFGQYGRLDSDGKQALAALRGRP